jgi:hypothetical protein
MGGAVLGRRGTACREEGWRRMGKGGGALGDRGVARGEGLGEWEPGIDTAMLGRRGAAGGGAWDQRGGGWRRP